MDKIKFADAKSYTYIELGQKWTTTNFNEKVVGDLLNNVYKDVCSWKVVDVRVPWYTKTYRAWRLKDLEWRFTFKIFNRSFSQPFLDWNLAYLDTYDLPIAGKLYSDGEIISYSSKEEWKVIVSSNWFTFQRKAGTKVTLLPELPSDFGKIINITSLSTWGFLDFNANVSWNAPYWTYVTVGNAKYLLPVASNGVYSASYRMKPTTLVNDTDEFLLDEKVIKDVVCILTAWLIAFKRWMPIAERLLSVWYANLQRFYNDESEDTANTNDTIKVKPFGGFTPSYRRYGR